MPMKMRKNAIIEKIKQVFFEIYLEKKYFYT